MDEPQLARGAIDPDHGGIPAGTRDVFRVVWFPDHAPMLVRYVRSQAAAERIAALHEDFHPIIEYRTVTYSEWTTVKDGAQ